MAKVKASTIWLDCCSGCHMSFLDIDEAIVDLSRKVEIQRSPISDIKGFAPVDIGIVEGAVGNTHDRDVLVRLRENCRILMAWGDCACFGGISTMRNLFDKQAVLQRGFVETESTQAGKVPVSDDLPQLLGAVRPINQFVKVDCYIPGCPPSAEVIIYALNELLEGRIPVLAKEMMRFD